MVNTQTINILQHNINNWNNNKTTLTSIYKELDPDLILINSHGLKSSENIKIYPYVTYKINTSEERQDGSAILIKPNLKYKIKDDYDTDIIQATIDTSTGPINIATTYLPPRRPYLPFPDFHNIASQSHPSYIIGDLNAHHPTIDRKRGNNVGKALKMMIDNNKLRHIGPDFATFYSHNASTTPDIILGNTQTYHNIHAIPGPVTPSDHLPILIKITLHPITIPATPTYRIDKTNWDEFTREVCNKTRNINTDPHMNQETLEKSLTEWTISITSTMQEHTPITTQKTIHKPIYNQRIKELQFWAKRLLENSLNTGWTYTKYIIYKTIKRAITEECKDQNNKNWESKVNNLNNIYKDPKNFWQNINKLKGSTDNHKGYLVHENRKIYDDKGKEQIFRDIWSKVFRISQEENQEFDQETEITVNDYINDNTFNISPNIQGNPQLLNNDYFTLEITIEDIKNIIKQMKNNSPGQTKINKTILQKLPDETLEVYRMLLNISLSMGYFPKVFKHAKLKLIPKPNKPSTDPNNYRPISLLEVPGKIFEKIINTRLRTFLETNDILPKSQHGFRRHRSTDTAIATISETIANALADKKQCCLVMRDVSKAFDKVWTKGLKFKIQHLQLPTILAKVLNSFLDNRTASISLKSFEGPPFELLSGVPQGSSLSPTLYTIYTHDIPPPITDGINIQYADDITQIIIQPGKSRNMLARKIEREIAHINNYENKWKIKTNTSKFTILPLAITKTTPVTIDGNIIEYSNKANILGLKLGTQGYNRHVKDISTKASVALQTIRRFDRLDTNIKLHLVKACVLPILTYPAYTLNSLSKTQLLKLQRVQNKAIRFAYNERYPYTRTTEELHSLANLQPINITLHNRGNKIKLKMTNIVQDRIYIDAINEDQQGREHGWFKKPRTNLSRDNPPPIYK